jgi:drug/metabolite transporter (DMT)-like permease
MLSMPNLSTAGAAYWMLSVTAFFLACNHVIGRSIEGVIPPLGLSFWRWFAGVIILLPLVLPRLKQSLPHYRANLGVLAAMGFMMVGSTTLILVALNYTTAINTSLMNAVQPALTVLFAVLFIGERMTPLKAFGVIISLLGVLLMITKADWQMLMGLQFNRGDLIALLAMCGFAGYAITLRKIPGSLNGSERLFAIALLGSLMLLPFYLYEHVNHMQVPVTGQTVLIVCALALLVSVLGNAMWNAGIMIIGPSKATMFINLIPLFGAILAVMWLGESLQFYHLLGGAMVCSGIKCVITQSR